MSETNESGSSRIDSYCGLLLAVFAAILAITDLGGGKYGDDEMIAVNEKAQAYAWYQVKSTKEVITKGNVELLSALEKVGVINENKKGSADSILSKWNKKIEKYDKEGNEILNGSAVVGKDNWVQDKDGQMGVIVGAKEWEGTIEKLGKAGDQFDMGSLFLQLCLVLGAISLITPKQSSKRNFMMAMTILGIIGSCFSAYGFYLANS